MLDVSKLDDYELAFLAFAVERYEDEEDRHTTKFKKSMENVQTVVDREYKRRKLKSERFEKKYVTEVVDEE